MVFPTVCEPPLASLADLIGEIAAGRPEALEEARLAAARDWTTAAPTLAAMLHHDEPRVRAAACAILAASPDEGRLGMLLPRASDSDWRVRMAAFHALAAAGRFQGEPLRDTPLDEREAILLAWLDAHDAASAAPLGRDLCELYAGDRHVEFGRPLAARCLVCHAGAAPAPFMASETCGNCHGRTYQEWSGSAHAQSLSHLRLATVNPTTREPQQMDFGEVRGIGCRECHRPAAEPSAPIPQDRAPTTGSNATRTGLTACPFRFAADAAASESCARCHASTAAEWRAWLKGPQPRIATWPPGEIQTDRRGDTRTCVDCHMPAGRVSEGKAEEHAHTWAARRDVERLRDGLAVRSEVPRGVSSPEVRMRLINLSGHAYPTGTRRRALRILVAAPAAAGSAAVYRVPPLAPGEQREFVLPVPGGAATLMIRLQYCRDVTDPAAAVTDVFSAEEDLRKWVGPQ
jgi:hypothetical protein